jgi:hypothetical protein
MKRAVETVMDEEDKGDDYDLEVRIELEDERLYSDAPFANTALE